MADMPIYDTGAIKSQSLFELRELFRYRFLVSNLVARDLKVRYKRSVLGFVWVMLNPLLTMGVLVIVFSNLLHVTIQHYPVYLLCGILIFTLFAQASTAAMGIDRTAPVTCEPSSFGRTGLPAQVLASKQLALGVNVANRGPDLFICVSLDVFHQEIEQTRLALQDTQQAAQI